MATMLITGANRGLGFEFARQYAASGWRVLAACRDPTNATDLQRLAQEMRPSVSVIAIDVADLENVRTAAKALEGNSVDLLVNCAGIAGTRGHRAGSVDYGSWRQLLDVNTMGPLRVLESFLGHIARAERSLVITITSGMGSLADNTSGGSIPYRSSKAAVNMVMRSAAIDLASLGITCVLVNPGWVKTDMGGPGATLEPQESVTAMRRLIERLGPADSGKFFNYDGREYPW